MLDIFKTIHNFKDFKDSIGTEILCIKTSPSGRNNIPLKIFIKGQKYKLYDICFDKIYYDFYQEKFHHMIIDAEHESNYECYWTDLNTFFEPIHVTRKRKTKKVLQKLKNFPIFEL